MSRKLLELAQSRQKTITIKGETLRLKQPSALSMSSYRKLAGDNNLPGAVATLIAHCVVDDKDKPVYSYDEALQLARSPDLSLIGPLVEALTGWDPPDPEKKSLSPSNDSSTDLPLPSASPTSEPSIS